VPSLTKSHPDMFANSAPVMVIPVVPLGLSKVHEVSVALAGVTNPHRLKVVPVAVVLD